MNPKINDPISWVKKGGCKNTDITAQIQGFKVAKKRGVQA